MASNDTKILIDNGGSKRSDVIKDNGVDSAQEFIAKVRHYNRQGPHFLYGSTTGTGRIPTPVRRLIRKSGKYNVSRYAKSEIWDKYLRDFSNTLVNSRWRWTIIASTSSFLLSWLLFGVIWMLIANANGDVDLFNPSSTPCLSGIKSFAGYFLFSLETQATIGYGSRYISHHCPEAVFILCLQIIMGCAICGLMVNIVYLKMMKPLKKYSKRLFSKHAVVCRRDGELCLVFRVRDEDAKHAVSTVVNAYILMKEKASEEPCLETLSIEPHGFLIWPLEIVHKITRTSPLWDISSYDLISDNFELIVQLQGTSPTTGQCTKTRTSYLSSEILWGHRFTRCVRYANQEKSYVISHKDFNVTQEHSIHLCSAKRVAEVFQYVNPTNTPSPNSHPKKIEINIVHSKRMTYLPAQVIEKSDHSTPTDEKEDGWNQANAVKCTQKRRSQYEGVDEPEETAELLPKFNFTVNETAKPLPPNVCHSYDNVTLDMHNGVDEPKAGTELLPKLNLTLNESTKPSHTNLSPSYDNVTLEAHGKFSSHYEVPCNNSLTLAVPPVPKSMSCHQFRNVQKHSSQNSLTSTGGISNVSSKTNAFSEEIMDLDAILAYLEEYLEKNGQ